ncbi:MAG: hypothetical protein M3R03_02325 [Pseudomonadota bacterium]|nr:hypothetical protein [Pseudomonadota bacterium]
MKRLTIASIAAPMLLIGACNVTDNGNGSSTISLDENRIERGTDMLANEASEAGAEAANAVENAGPAIKQGAADIKEGAGRVADRVENVDVDVDLNTSDGKTKNAQ